MDHDKQVSRLSGPPKLPESPISRFLDRAPQPDDRPRETFDLETEFAKTAKNRSLLIPLAVLGFVLVLAAGAWWASGLTDEASAKASVSIGSFEDLKLKEIFDTARRNKKDLENVQAQIQELTQASALRVEALQKASASQVEVASIDDASGEKGKAIEATTAQAIASEKARLAAALRPLKAQADEIQKKIDSYDDRIGQLNRQNQQVLDTQQRVFEIEKTKMRDQYEARILSLSEERATMEARLKKERDDLGAALRTKHADDIRKLILKYNPILSDPLLTAQLTSGTPVYPGAFPARIADAGLISPELQASLAQRVETFQKLLALAQAIPFENSVPGLLHALEVSMADALVGFDGYLAPLADHMVVLDNTIRDRLADIAAREAEIANLQADLESLQFDYRDLEATLADEKAAREADRQAALLVRQDDAARLARWTGAVDAFVSTLKEDGVLVDVNSPTDLIVVLRADRAQALVAALATPPVVPASGKAPPPPNQAVVRDGLSGSELATVLVTPFEDRWQAQVITLKDKKKPIKAMDRLVLVLPNKK